MIAQVPLSTIIQYGDFEIFLSSYSCISLYSLRAIDTRIVNNNVMPVPIKCAMSKLKFAMSVIMSMALIICVGSIIIVPGGTDIVFAISNDMLTATPVRDINTPKRPVSTPVPSNQKAALFS